VLDFGFTDRGPRGLNLPPDDKLLERLYCFEDLEDDMHLLLGGKRRRVILKVHTLGLWRERGDKLYERASKVTAVKFMYAYWNAHKRMFEMDPQSELKILPVSKTLKEKWRDSYRQKRYGDIEWEWRIPDSMPSLDPDTGDGEVKRVYDEVRAAIKLGERMFHRGAKATDKCMQDHDSPWQEVNGLVQVSSYLTPSFLLPLLIRPTIPCQYQVALFFEKNWMPNTKSLTYNFQTNSMLRDGSEVEYDAFLAEDVADRLKEEWKRPMHWAGFLVVGAATRLPSPEGGGVVSGVSAEAESVVAVKPFEEWDVNEVYELFHSIGFAEAADAIRENSVDGKTLISAGFDKLLTMDTSGAIGHKRSQT
jgi:hypothetical protein